MSDWDKIRRNARHSGTFVGRSQEDQDAYFAFFANERPRLLHRIKLDAGRLWGR